MKVYKLDFNERYLGLECEMDLFYKYFKHIESAWSFTDFSNNWDFPILSFDKSKYYMGKRLKLNTDYPSLSKSGDVLIISEKGKECLKGLLDNNGQYLSIETDVNKTFYAFNISLYLEAIDKDKSITKKSTSGKIMRYIKYEFFEDIVKDRVIFKVKEKSGKFVTSKFVDRILECKLKGFHFIPLWDSESNELGEDIFT